MALCAQSRALSPEPARPLSAEARSHRRPQTIFWQLHSAKGNSPRAANHSPNAPRIEKATQAVFAPDPPLSIGRTGAWLPRLPGPCCFAAGPRARNPLPTGSPSWGSRIGRGKAFCAQAPGKPPSQLGCSAPRSRRTDAPNELLTAAFCKGKLSSGSKPQPQRASDPERNASRFRPRHPPLHRANRGWAATVPGTC